MHRHITASGTNIDFQPWTISYVLLQQNSTEPIGDLARGLYDYYRKALPLA